MVTVDKAWRCFSGAQTTTTTPGTVNTAGEDKREVLCIHGKQKRHAEMIYFDWTRGDCRQRTNTTRLLELGEVEELEEGM